MSDNGKSRNAANEQLMPCPFCGERAYIVQHAFFTGDVTYGVVCDFCKGQGYQFFPTMGEAVDAWNNRIPVPQEMTARDFVVAHHRMCQSEMECVECRICHDDEAPRSCAVLMGLNPDDTVAVVEQWAREHEERSEEND